MKSQEKNKPLSKNLIIISMLNLITGILLNISTAKPNCKIIYIYIYIYISISNLHLRYMIGINKIWKSLNCYLNKLKCLYYLANILFVFTNTHGSFRFDFLLQDLIILCLICWWFEFFNKYIFFSFGKSIIVSSYPIIYQFLSYIYAFQFQTVLPLRNAVII